MSLPMEERVKVLDLLQPIADSARFRRPHRRFCSPPRALLLRVPRRRFPRAPASSGTPLRAPPPLGLRPSASPRTDPAMAELPVPHARPSSSPAKRGGGGDGSASSPFLPSTRAGGGGTDGTSRSSPPLYPAPVRALLACLALTAAPVPASGAAVQRHRPSALVQRLLPFLNQIQMAAANNGSDIGRQASEARVSVSANKEVGGSDSGLVDESVDGAVPVVEPLAAEASAAER